MTSECRNHQCEFCCKAWSEADEPDPLGPRLVCPAHGKWSSLADGMSCPLCAAPAAPLAQEAVAWLSTVVTAAGNKLQRLGFTRDEAEMANATPIPLYAAPPRPDAQEMGHEIWDCECGQVNASWASICGRCERYRPIAPNESETHYLRRTNESLVHAPGAALREQGCSVCGQVWAVQRMNCPRIDCPSHQPVHAPGPDDGLVARLNRKHDMDCELNGDPCDHTLNCTCSWIERREAAAELTRLREQLRFRVACQIRTDADVTDLRAEVAAKEKERADAQQMADYFKGGFSGQKERADKAQSALAASQSALAEARVREQTLGEIIELMSNIQNMSDAELSQLVAKCRAALAQQQGRVT